MKRNELKRKAESRLKAIKGSYKEGLYDEVVADSGLVVEFALKASVCKAIKSDIYPEGIRKYRTHDAETLIDLSKLRKELEEEKINNLDFFISWSLLSKWSINFRYKPPGSYDINTSKDYISALDGEKGGVYTWIKTKWWVI